MAEPMWPVTKERIDSALCRLTSGDGSMRVPADPTDADVLIADMQAERDALAEEVKRLREEKGREEQRCIAHAAYNPEGDCIYCDHEQEKERAEAAEEEVTRLKDMVTAFESEIGQEMPSDFKDWHENSPTEHSLVARLVLKMRRERAETAERENARLREYRERALADIQDLINERGEQAKRADAAEQANAALRERVEEVQAERNGIISRFRLKWPHIEITRGSVPLGEPRTKDPGPPTCLRCSIEDEVIGEPWHDGLGPTRGTAR